MPIYEYVCEDCRCEFEELVLCGQEEVSCPQCKSHNVQKQMSVCRAKWGSGSGGDGGPSSIGGSSCSGCSGGNCASCGG